MPAQFKPCAWDGSQLHTMRGGSGEAQAQAMKAAEPEGESERRCMCWFVFDCKAAYGAIVLATFVKGLRVCCRLALVMMRL